MKILLSQLLKKPAVNGYEPYGGIQKYIKKYCSSIDGVSYVSDMLGNILVSKGQGKKIILLEAHIDEVGFLVAKNLTGNNLKLLPIGEIPQGGVEKAEILINRGLGLVATAVIGKKFKASIMSGSSARPGDWCFFARKTMFKGNTVNAPALDNRVGCAVLLEFIRDIKTPTDVCLKVLLGTQHEQGSRTGIYDWIRRLNPNLVIIMDSAYAAPNGKPEWQVPRLGCGPAIQLMGKDFVVPGVIVEKIRKIAERNNIPYQLEIPDQYNGGTNASRIPNSIPFVVINIPVADQHTAKSKADLRDLKSAKRLLEKVVLNAQATLFQ